MPKLKIAIVGLGAAGAFAARAAYDMGCEVEIFSTTQTLQMSPGATWLHWIPEDVAAKFTPTQIYVVGKGTAEQYSKRQWGKVVPSSFPTEPVWEIGYDPMKVLPDLVPASCNVNMIPYQMSDTDVADMSVAFDMVFQTFPTKDSKEFQPPLIPFVAAAKIGTEPLDKNYAVYNGTKDGFVVREAVLFGSKFLEFPKNMLLRELEEVVDLTEYKTVTLKDLDPATKPWQHSHPKIHLLGRMAMWDRKFLSHDAYAFAQKKIQEAQDVSA